MNRKIIFVLALLGCTQISWSAVTELSARFYKGKTYITFKEEAGTAITYKLYRSRQTINNVSSLQPVATIAQGSGYDTRYSWFHIISNLGAPLSAGTGLFVYTPHDTANAYYAITTVNSGTENSTLVSGSNVLTSAVSEQYWQWPGAILRSINGTDYVYGYWMDYTDWCHSMDYYGDIFAVADGGNFRTTQNAPLTVYLHGVENTQSHTTPNPSGLSTELNLELYDFALRTTQPRNNWWFGVSKRYLDGGQQIHPGDTVVNYTQMRIFSYVNSMRSDSLFSIDTNRLYIKGGSMGGAGAIHGALHFPSMWAACRPNVPVINMDFYYGFYNTYPHSYFELLYGTKDQNCRVRNGCTIYQWVDPNWICQNNFDIDYPPIVLTHTSDDGPRSMRMYRTFYNTFNNTRQALFGNWRAGGHIEVATVMAGGYQRFRKNELYPAFTNCSTVNDYGQRSSDTSNAPVNPAQETLVFDAAGEYGTFIDWTSSLHDLGLPADDLVDGNDSIALTIRSSRTNTKADVTLRRIQTFRVVKGKDYVWKTMSVSTGSLIGSGTVTVGTHGLLTIPQVSILETGTRLTIKSSLPSKTKDAPLKPSLNFYGQSIGVAITNTPAVLVLTLTKNMIATIEVIDLQGQVVKSITDYSLSIGKHKVPLEGLHSGSYLCKISAGNTKIHRKLFFVK